MSEMNNLKKLGVAGALGASLLAFAHGADDCARAGARATASASDDVARIATPAAPDGQVSGRRPSTGLPDGIAQIAPVVQRRSSALPATDDAPKTPGARREFGEELASHTLDAVDLLLDTGDGSDQLESWGPIGAPTYIALDTSSSRADFAHELGAASVGPPVFVIGRASVSAADAISISNSAMAVGEIQSECLSHGVGCVVLICGVEDGSAANCVARALAMTRAAVAKASRRLDRALQALLRERSARRWTTLDIYRLLDTPEGPRIVRSRARGGRTE